MKRNFLLSAGLSLFSLCGLLLSGAKAQEESTPDKYPVSLYSLKTTETAPAHPTEGWTEFQLPARNADNQLDTLNELYLRVGAEPVNIAEQYDKETNKPIPMDSSVLTAIGFDFMYEGRKITHFGLTGNGFIYLGTEKASGKDVKRLLKYRSSIYGMTDAIVAALGSDIYGYQSTTEPNFIADGQTKIGYQKDADNNYLIISFRDVLVGSYYMKSWSESIPYSIRWSYDLILYKDGNIALRIVDAEMPEIETTKPILYFTYTLFGADASGISALDWEGKTETIEIESQAKSMAVTEAAKTTVLTYTTPELCVAPAGVTATLNTTELFSTDFTADLTLNGTCDGWLVFAADNKEVTDKPENGKTYSAGSWNTDPDVIGGCDIRIAGTDVSLSMSHLKPSDTTYVYVYPYNAQCLGGPIYQENPIILSVTTPVGAPTVKMEQVNANSVQFKFPELDADAKILVGMARRDYRDESNPRYILANISGKAYKKGDTLYYNPSTEVSDYSNHGPYFIEAAHVGTVENKTLTIDGLQAGTPYYFYFWTALEGENQYSSEYSETGIHTTATTPFSFTFANDRAPITAESDYLPAGWNSSEGMDAYFRAAMYSFGLTGIEGDPDDIRSLGVRLVGASMTATEVKADIITPAFRSSHKDFDVRYQVQMQSSGWAGSDLSQLGSSDTLTVWYRATDQTDWTLMGTTTNETTFVYDANNYATLKATAHNVPQDKDVQLRFMVKAEPGGMMSSKIFVLHHVLVEPHLACAYPEDLAISDSLTTHKTIGLTWKDINTPVASTIFRYRESGAQTWSAWQSAQQPTACLARKLNGNTVYEIAVQSVCRSDSSLIKTVEATTLRGLDYAQSLKNLKELPADMEGRRGALPQDKDKVVETAADKYHQGFTIQNHRDTVVGTTFMSGYWLNLPALCMEDIAAPAEFSFNYKAYYFDAAQNSLSKVNPNSTFRVLVMVSKDGSFKRTDSVGELTVKAMDTTYQTCTIDLSRHTRQLHIALYVENGDAYDQMNANMNSFFVINGVSVRYTGDRPCDPVENIRQYNLTTTGITIEWDGSAFEYGIIYTNMEAEKTDTAFTTENIYTFNNLEPGTAYSYCIVAFCDEGHHSPSVPSETRYFNTRRACEVPTNFAVARTTWESVTITAHSESDKLCHLWGKSENVDGFHFTTDWSAERDTLILLALKEKATYYVAVRSVCSAGDSSAWTEPIEFTTPARVAIENSSKLEGLKAGVSNGHIVIWNSNALTIDRVEVYNMTGQNLYSKDFHTNGHIWLPSLTEGTRMVLIRVLSNGKTAVYKIVLK